MLEGLEQLHAELNRIRRPRQATLTPGPGLPPVEVRVGDEVAFLYGGEARRVRVLAVMSWGIRARDLDKEAVRAFKYGKIGVAEGEMDAAP